MWINVWKGVYDLNTRILKDRHNLDYTKICTGVENSEVQKKWMLNYTRALIHEIAEFYDESNDHKAKIELIDIIFFLIAVFQLSGKDFFSFDKIIRSQHTPFDIEDWYPENMIFSAIKIENSIAWKHWKTYDKNTILSQDFYKNIESFIEDWKEYVYIFYRMTETQVFQAFEDKLKVNHNRQDSGYINKEKDDDIHVRTNS